MTGWTLFLFFFVALGDGWSSLFYTWRAARSRIVVGFQDCTGIAVRFWIVIFVRCCRGI